jgi:tetratricopeptide (TPR) repeat protein
MTLAALFRCPVVLLLAVLVPAASAAQPAAQILAPIDRAMALAEESLRAGEFQIAESRYRAAAFDAWMTSGALHVAAGRLPEARDAFRQATATVADAHAAFRSLALVYMQTGEAADAVTILTMLSARAPADSQGRRLLAQALAANGQHGEAIQTLEEARAAAPGDAEVAFLLASAYLQAKRVDAAERLFQEVVSARPIPATWVLIGRTYRDFRLFDRARDALRKALAQDPSTRRAHYYLGTLAVMAEGDVPLEEAIREFRAELKLAPEDAAANLRLGMALVETRREAEALAPLQAAVRVAPSAIALHHLGRAQLALDRPADAVRSLRRALELATAAGEGPSRMQSVHYQLGLALRQTGAAAEAAVHFQAAKDASARSADAERERLTQYLEDSADSTPGASRLALDSPFAAVPAAVRDAAAAGVKTALARAYLNLGVMRAQEKQFARAADFLQQAAAIDPDFPQVQFSLGVARFNARQYDKATAPLARAFGADAGNTGLRRMLALAHFNAGAYAQAADLLAADPQREEDPSLQFTYGVALVRSDRASDAQGVFTRMLARHGDRAEIHVILGQAHAEQGNFEAAVQALERARALNAKVADANATLGLIFLKQGKLAEAAAALREELRSNPGNLPARHTLATVLDLEGKTSEAVALLGSVLEQQPEFANARYLLGKILLAGGEAERAVPHLEAAVRLSPDDASYHFQLAQAYRAAGRVELAEKHLAIFQALKDKARRRTP